MYAKILSFLASFLWIITWVLFLVVYHASIANTAKRKRLRYRIFFQLLYIWFDFCVITRYQDLIIKQCIMFTLWLVIQCKIQLYINQDFITRIQCCSGRVCKREFLFILFGNNAQNTYFELVNNTYLSDYMLQ